VIDRYTRPVMARLWSDEAVLERWLAIELALVDVLAEQQQVPVEAARALRAHARVNPARMKEIEAETRHDVIAFVSSVAETVGDEGRWLHLGLTSSDVVDTAFAMGLRDAAGVILKSLDGLRAAVRTQAVRHRETPMIGRTHGIHAEPITFGLKCASWYAELGRDRRRLAAARDDIAFGKLSGAVGTFANNDPSVEAAVLARLELKPEPIATQVVPRDRHAAYFATLAVVAGTCERIALEIRHLQRTEVGEALEPFGKGQKGSSAMPHKRNPILVENLCGLARLVRSHAGAAFENMALWHERDISHSSVERVIGPDATTTLDFMLARLAGVVEGLEVRPDAMARNLARLGGAIFSEQVLLALVRKGVARDQAYRWIQRHALAGDGLEARLAGDADVGRHLSSDELHALFDMTHHLRHIDALFKRALADGDRAGSPEDGDGAG
jgi:adenylosuccinate lyase